MMQIIDNISTLLGDDMRAALTKGAKLKIAASCFSIYAYEALKKELSRVDALEFIFTAPTFLPEGATDKFRKERREFFIPKAQRERSLYGSEFEIQLRNQLTQKAVARECAAWIRAKASFRSNKTKAPMQQFICIDGAAEPVAYMPINGFTAVDLGLQKGNAVSNIVNRFDGAPYTNTYLDLFNQIWADPEKLQDVTDSICQHIESVYQENSPERIYFLILYNLFSEFLEEVDEDVLPNDRTGYLDSVVWNKLFNFQRDAATGIINKLETFSGCILADSVGLGKTFTALAVIKYYELRNRAVLVLCPKKLADNWLNFNSNLKTNLFAKDRFNYDVLCHTDLSRTGGESFGIPLNRVNWGNYDLVVIDESHNFRNNDIYKDRETRYQKLMNQVIREGVKTKVLMLSATPVNNRFTDLRNQLALAYEGRSEILNQKLKTTSSIEEIFRRAQTAFNAWSKLPPKERTAQAILQMLDFDFFELLDSVTIARSRKHIETFYDTTEIGKFPERRKPLSFRCPLTERTDVMTLNDIVGQLSVLKLSVYAPLSYILPSRLSKYEDLYDTEVIGGRGRLRQADRERSLQALMTTNLLKRLESSVEAFRLTLRSLKRNHTATLDAIADYQQSGRTQDISDYTSNVDDFDPDDDDFDGLGEFTVGKKIQISLADMDVQSWQHDLKGDLAVIDALLASMDMIRPEDDAKLQHLKAHIRQKIANPINGENRKVLLFTAFSDTANYLYANLAKELRDGPGLHTARVTGTDAPKTTLKKSYDFQSILTLFSPRSKEKALILPNEDAEIDILIGTDCISEGQNLQDCDYLINYDIHWNPVRIIQRFGRIDRLGSPNERIQLVNFWPNMELEEYLDLEQRVSGRMVLLDISATGEENLIEKQSGDPMNDLEYRRKQLLKLQDAVIDLEDLSTGVSIADLTLTDFRIDLAEFQREHGDVLDAVPLGACGITTSRDADIEPGIIFCLRAEGPAAARAAEPGYSLAPHYLVHVGEDGAVLLPYPQTKQILDRLKRLCIGRDIPDASACERFDQETDRGKDMRKAQQLLAAAVASVVGKTEERAVASLFAPGGTHARRGEFAGNEDFEVTAFFVVLPGDAD